MCDDPELNSTIDSLGLCTPESGVFGQNRGFADVSRRSDIRVREQSQDPMHTGLLNVGFLLLDAMCT